MCRGVTACLSTLLGRIVHLAWVQLKHSAWEEAALEGWMLQSPLLLHLLDGWSHRDHPPRQCPAWFPPHSRSSVSGWARRVISALLWPRRCSKCRFLSLSHQSSASLKPSFRDERRSHYGSDGKESACSAEDVGLIPGSGRAPREGNGYLLQYSCLENSMDRGAWPATHPMRSQSTGHD